MACVGHQGQQLYHGLLGGREEVGFRFLHQKEHRPLLDQVIKEQVQDPHNLLLAGGSEVDLHIVLLVHPDPLLSVGSCVAASEDLLDQGQGLLVQLPLGCRHHRARQQPLHAVGKLGPQPHHPLQIVPGAGVQQALLGIVHGGVEIVELTAQHRQHAPPGGDIDRLKGVPEEFGQFLPQGLLVPDPLVALQKSADGLRILHPDKIRRQMVFDPLQADRHLYPLPIAVVQAHPLLHTEGRAKGTQELVAHMALKGPGQGPGCPVSVRVAIALLLPQQSPAENKPEQVLL